MNFDILIYSTESILVKSRFKLGYSLFHVPSPRTEPYFFNIVFSWSVILSRNHSYLLVCDYNKFIMILYTGKESLHHPILLRSEPTQLKSCRGPNSRLTKHFM